MVRRTLPPLPVRRPRDWHYDYTYTEPGQRVVIVPEPENSFDENALRIDDVGGSGMGYIPAEIAAKLSPGLRAHEVSIVDSVVTSVDRGQNWIGVFVQLTLELPD